MTTATRTPKQEVARLMRAFDYVAVKGHTLDEADRRLNSGMWDRQQWTVACDAATLWDRRERYEWALKFHHVVLGDSLDLAIRIAWNKTCDPADRDAGWN